MFPILSSEDTEDYDNEEEEVEIQKPSQLAAQVRWLREVITDTSLRQLGRESGNYVVLLKKYQQKVKWLQALQLATYFRFSFH